MCLSLIGLNVNVNAKQLPKVGNLFCIDSISVNALMCIACRTSFICSNCVCVQCVFYVLIWVFGRNRTMVHNMRIICNYLPFSTSNDDYVHWFCLFTACNTLQLSCETICVYYKKYYDSIHGTAISVYDIRLGLFFFFFGMLKSNPQMCTRR